MKGKSNLKKMLNLNNVFSKKNMNLENIVVAVLVVVLVVLVVYYVRKNREGFNDDEKPTLYFFFVDWCPHCTTAKENVFDEFNKNVKNSDKVNLVKVNCEGSEEEKNLAKEHNVRGYPTVVLKENNGKTHELDEGVSASSINSLISRF